jgi:hypothetical protein
MGKAVKKLSARAVATIAQPGRHSDGDGAVPQRDAIERAASGTPWRLMLNMLLSFAQFEREIAGERIRDKIAASKRKGMWMGGNVPLGYDVRDRKMIINEPEGATVRLIFRRYAELGSVALQRFTGSSRSQAVKRTIGNTKSNILIWLRRGQLGGTCQVHNSSTKFQIDRALAQSHVCVSPNAAKIFSLFNPHSPDDALICCAMRICHATPF